MEALTHPWFDHGCPLIGLLHLGLWFRRDNGELLRSREGMHQRWPVGSSVPARKTLFAVIRSLVIRILERQRLIHQFKAPVVAPLFSEREISFEAELDSV